jgi:hypothetical protein
MPCVGFEVLTAAVLKSTIFWDITPFSPLRVNRRSGRTYRLHLQGWKISRSRNQSESRWQAVLAICSSETSVDSHRTTRRYIPADGNLQAMSSLLSLSILLYGVIGMAVFGAPTKSAEWVWPYLNTDDSLVTRILTRQLIIIVCIPPVLKLNKQLNILHNDTHVNKEIHILLQ